MSRQRRLLIDAAVAAVTIGCGLVLIATAPTEGLSRAEALCAPLGFLAVAIRRVAPLAVLAAIVAATVVVTVVTGGPTTLLFASFVVLYAACVESSRRNALLIGAGTAAALYVSAHVATLGSATDERTLIVVAWSALAVGVADAARSRRALIIAAEERVQAAVAAGTAQAREQVVEQRLAIARDLHDLLAHNLSVMNVQTAAALHVLRDNPDEAENSLRIAREAGRGILDELRDMLAVLRAGNRGPLDAPVAVTQTFDDVDALVDASRRAGLQVTVTREGVPRRLAPAASLAAYRLVQEALTNAAKHGSGNVRLSIGWGPELRIGATNDVAPTRQSAPGVEGSIGSGLGLTGARERLALVGGTLDIVENGREFTLHATLPVVPLSLVSPYEPDPSARPVVPSTPSVPT